MRYFLLCAIMFCSFGVVTAEPTVAERCQNNTIVITIGEGHGSGVLFTRTNTDGNEVTFIWTVAHFTGYTMKPNGAFHPVKIVRGDKKAEAIVLRTSDNDITHDIALLQITDNSFHGDAEFYQPFNHVKVGQSVIHVGTPLGKLHECSVFCGCVSFVDREFNTSLVLKPRMTDQINITIGGGCSGGGVFDAKTGGILGLASINTAPTILFITPTRYIYEWAKSHDCLWAFDRQVPLPTEIVPWRADCYTRIIAGRNTSEIDARWGEPEPEPDFN